MCHMCLLEVFFVYIACYMNLLTALSTAYRGFHPELASSRAEEQADGMSQVPGSARLRFAVGARVECYITRTSGSRALC